VAGAGERTGVLIVRVWAEGDPPGPIRARVTSNLDVSSPREAVQFCNSAQEVLAAVGAWLDGFLGGQPDSVPGR